MQKLFSTFADGWPGGGLLLGRLFTCVALFHFAAADSGDALLSSLIIPQLLSAGAGLLLSVGLWTPIAGTAVAVIETWIAFSRPGDPWHAILLAVLGATLAMVGPGAWSVDAMLFGRKRISSMV